ncbi:MAG: A/G-specific adenine glycosylase [Bacteroidaceae bacterium]|jgi:A/G-specific adenine glycosylase
MMMNSELTGDFSLLILEWYEKNRRPLPWRETDDPYKIWISEIILQQTRVNQGWAYYLRFVERFPTFFDLASAEPDEVMRLWQGLGYYSRARNLHKAARILAERGAFPRTYEQIRELPGIGDYTAAAISSIAYGLPHAVVDGNVYRVLARCFGIEEPIDTTGGKKYFARLAAELLPASNPGLYNQAIMDFGALQCVPQSPDCANCPLMAKCAAYADGRQAELPVKARQQQVTDVYLHYIYVRMGDAVCLRRRTGKVVGESAKEGASFASSAIWKGLYELPLVVTGQAVSPEQFLKSKEFRSFFASEAELQSASLSLLRCNVLHRLSHRQLHLNFYAVTFPEEVASFSGYMRVPFAECARFPVPRPIASLWKELGID